MSNPRQNKSIINRRAKFDYEFVDKFLAGVELYGHEVKSIRTGNADLRGAYVNVRNGEAWLVGAYVAPYPHANLSESYDALRTRKLLLNKNEIQKLIAAKQNKLTIVATKMLTTSRFIKIEIATARGKKLHDKREVIKKRDTERETKHKF